MGMRTYRFYPTVSAPEPVEEPVKEPEKKAGKTAKKAPTSRSKAVQGKEGGK